LQVIEKKETRRILLMSLVVAGLIFIGAYAFTMTQFSVIQLPTSVEKNNVEEGTPEIGTQTPTLQAAPQILATFPTNRASYSTVKGIVVTVDNGPDKSGVTSVAVSIDDGSRMSLVQTASNPAKWSSPLTSPVTQIGFHKISISATDSAGRITTTTVTFGVAPAQRPQI